jgi:uncharacterized OB-fold protein
MSDSAKQIPAIEGWMHNPVAEGEPAGDDFALLGTRCTECGTYFFPAERVFCRNPRCAGSEFEEVPLSTRGKLWSFTNNCYPPPAPYISADPFVPYAIAAVELEREKMVVLGQVAAGVGVEDLKAGMEMEIVRGTLFEDEEGERVIWNWKPVSA